MDTKILIIEDNVITLDEIETRLNDMGYSNIETAVSGKEAIEKAKIFKPSLVLSDINLGDDIDGIETILKINEEDSVPVVFLTAYDDDETLARAKTTMPYAFLSKPLKDRELNVAINIALHKSEIEKELRKSNATKDKLFSIIAHDLKNPFNSIMGFSQLLLKQNKVYSAEKREILINSIYRSSSQAVQLLDNLFLWANAQSGKIEYMPEEIEARMIVDDLLPSIELLGRNKQINVFSLVEDDLCVYADKTMLNIVLRNLLTNAIKFTQNGGVIYVNAELEDCGTFVKFSVIDNGIGIDPELMDKLFSAGKKVSTPGTNQEKGTGLGLILCKEFVMKNKGEIWAESQLGEGSEFYFKVPAGKSNLGVK